MAKTMAGNSETSLTRSGLRHADGSRPCLVRVLTRRTPIICMLMWHCGKVIVTVSANNPPWAPATLFASVKCRERRGSHEDKRDVSCFWRCGPVVGGGGQRGIGSGATRVIPTVMGSGNGSGWVLGRGPAADDKSGDLQGGSTPRPT